MFWIKRGRALNPPPPVHVPADSGVIIINLDLHVHLVLMGCRVLLASRRCHLACLLSGLECPLIAMVWENTCGLCRQSNTWKMGMGKCMYVRGFSDEDEILFVIAFVKRICLPRLANCYKLFRHRKETLLGPPVCKCVSQNSCRELHDLSIKDVWWSMLVQRAWAITGTCANKVKLSSTSLKCAWAVKLFRCHFWAKLDLKSWKHLQTMIFLTTSSMG